MKLGKDMKLLDGLPILYIKSLSALVCSDLHLGYEGVYASKGSFIPKINLRKIKEMLGKGIESTNAKNIIIVGDIKNEFSTVEIEEFNEFRELVAYLRKDLGIDGITLIKGNHDNFIDRFKQALKFEIYAQEALIKDYLLFHGEELPGKGGKVLIMGHLHPAVAVYNKVGTKEKLRCFLEGKTEDGRKIIILPAMNYFAEGVDVNQSRVRDMAPIFKKELDVNNMRALCLGEEEILDFGKVGDLKRLNA